MNAIINTTSIVIIMFLDVMTNVYKTFVITFMNVVYTIFTYINNICYLYNE